MPASLEQDLRGVGELRARRVVTAAYLHLRSLRGGLEDYDATAAEPYRRWLHELLVHSPLAAQLLEGPQALAAPGTAEGLASELGPGDVEDMVELVAGRLLYYLDPGRRPLGVLARGPLWLWGLGLALLLLPWLAWLARPHIAWAIPTALPTLEQITGALLRFALVCAGGIAVWLSVLFATAGEAERGRKVSLQRRMEAMALYAYLVEAYGGGAGAVPVASGPTASAVQDEPGPAPETPSLGDWG